MPPLTLATKDGEPTPEWQKLPDDERSRQEARSNFEWYRRVMTGPDRLDASGRPNGRLHSIQNR